MRLCNLASGSSGNCTYIGDDHTHLCVDAGISGKRMENGLNEIGLSTADMTGILITHEHSDHIGGLGVISRRYGIPIYATGGTIAEILRLPRFQDIPKELFHEIHAEEDFRLGDFSIHPIRISHDAADPVAFRFENGGHSMAIMTDLGTYDDAVVASLTGVEALMLEANHDVRMLQAGPYPYYLKKRILSDEGHLSNESCGKLLARLLHDKLKAVILGHLSKENNMEELAYETVRSEIAMSDSPFRFSELPIRMAKRTERTELLTV
ncbi:MAG: MBL fold metallo-hydrolase [Lachnospiraceae bacterium]|nr:MBL fold metallo-hydrolase [Lachnospiraceae bacterium]